MSAITAACQVVRIVANGIKLQRKVEEVVNSDGDSQSLKIADVVVNTLVLAADAGGVVAKIDGASVETLENIKDGEMVARVMSLPVIAFGSLFKWVKGESSAMRAIEDGLLTPIAGIGRSASEVSGYHYRHLQSLPDDQRVDHVCVQVGGGFERRMECHDEKLTEQQCVDRAQQADEQCAAFAVVEIVSDLNVISRVISRESIYQRVVNQIYVTPVAPRNVIVVDDVINDDDDVIVDATPVAPQNVIVVEDDVIADPLSVNLLSLPYIPEALHNDPIFKKYPCSIMQAPIRYPLKDPRGVGHLYEASVIRQWLSINRTCPLTRQPLSMEELVEVPMLQRIIDERLTHYQNDINAAIRAGIVMIPSNPEDDQLLDQENPYYRDI
ncbi:MAG: U-box domain-containing protein [Parachlamydiaceae bacterium]